MIIGESEKKFWVILWVFDLFVCFGGLRLGFLYGCSIPGFP